MNKGLIKAVQTGRRKLGLDDEEYRSMLEDISGKRSAKELTVQQLRKVLDRMRQAGFRLATDMQIRKIKSLWYAMHEHGLVRVKTDSAIAAYVRRITKKELRKCDESDLSRVIETLKKWIGRLEDKEARERLYREFVTMPVDTSIMQ